MGLSRKRQREFNRLKRQTEDLLREQREIVDHASRVVREAGRQAASFTREEVRPRVRDTFEDRVRPAVASAVGSALAVIEAAKNPALRETIARVSKNARAVGAKTGLIEPPKSSSPAKYIVLGVALVAIAGAAYAAWQTLRADDSLWVEDEVEVENG